MVVANSLLILAACLHLDLGSAEGVCDTECFTELQQLVNKIADIALPKTLNICFTLSDLAHSVPEK